MKIGIFTFHCAINYGAVLQTFALQEYLKKQGHEVYVINYRPDYLINEYKLFSWKWRFNESIRSNIILFIRSLLVMPIKIKRKYMFSRFVNKYLNLFSFNQEKIERGFDVFVFGSDQIWNPLITNGLDKIFFGKIPHTDNVLKISYAASAGCVDNLCPYKYEFKNLVLNLNYISVRERSLSNFLLNRFKIESEVVVDPVFLLNKKKYMSISLNKQIKKSPYLLVFKLQNSDYVDAINDMANKIASEKGLTIIELSSSSESLKNERSLNSIGISGFISLFMNADYILTTSFHGTAFSLIFEKDFNTVCYNREKSERIIGLLNQLGLQNRFVDGTSVYETGIIDYDTIHKKLCMLKSKSEQFLEKVLSTVAS